MSFTRKNIAILGSTGSVGTQALQVIDDYRDSFDVHVLCANKNADLLIQQALKYLPNKVIIVCEDKYPIVKAALQTTSIEVLTGSTAIVDTVQDSEIDMVLTAMVGSVGLKPTIAAIKAGKDIALANKETLVVAGELVMQLAKEHQVAILPVDSEHSAIFQCLVGENTESVEKLILTASGGPFRGRDRDFLSRVSREDALNHPNWKMGSKITIDSATLMNKGLEVIEARWLFDLLPEQIDVVVHPQSIVHSLVQYRDGSLKAQLGKPDMKLPIQFALTYPERWLSQDERFSFSDYHSLTFETPDTQTFRCLDLAYKALKEGGDRPCVLNAANEIAVEAFLQDQISFLQISDIIEETLCRVECQKIDTFEGYISKDREAKDVARDLIIQ